MYIHDSLNFKTQRDLDINTKNVESLSIELISKNSKNTVLSTIYRPPDGDYKTFNTFLTDIYSISLKSNKLFYAAGDFNFNVLDYNKNEKVTEFLNLAFEYGFVPVIDKPTRVTKNTGIAIDHIFTNSLLHRTITPGILKLDISDHFPIFLIAKTDKKITLEGKVQITKRLINNKTKEKFKNALEEMTWDDVISSKQTDSVYEAFLDKITSLYDKIFEKFPVTVKSKTLKNPWVTKGILKSSKTKQRLYDKYLKSKIYEHEISYKNYRKLSESIKQRAKSLYYSKMTLHYKDNIKKTWQIMKKVIGKGKLVNNSLPKHLILNNRNIFDQKTIAKSFNEYFVNVGPKLACEIPQSQRSFKMYLMKK